MKRLSILLLFVVALVVCGGCSTSTFQPPAVCDGAESLILERIPDPAALSKALLIVQIGVLEAVDGYDVSDAGKVIDQIETVVDGGVTYADLVGLILKKVDAANRLAGAAVFLVGDEINLLDAPGFLSVCDRELIRMHLAKQRAMLKIYGGAS